MLGIKSKNKMHSIFNPRMCLKHTLEASWSCNLETPEDEKLPVEHIGGVPRLCFKYKESEHDWLCGVVPLNKANWAGFDVRNHRDLKFTFYEESGVSLKVSLVDEKENESESISLTEVQGVEPGQESEICLSINTFYNKKFNPQKAKMVKFIGINKPHFYVSSLYLY